jgi:uncharacterized membrane protein
MSLKSEFVTNVLVSAPLNITVGVVSALMGAPTIIPIVLCGLAKATMNWSWTRKADDRPFSKVLHHTPSLILLPLIAANIGGVTCFFTQRIMQKPVENKTTFVVPNSNLIRVERSR